MEIEGAWVERKGAGFAYHLRETPGPLRRAAERRAAAICRRHKLRVRGGKCVVEVRPPIEWHKGHAVLHVLKHRHGADWPTKLRALYIGDDVTDEDAFRSLRGIGRSICVAADPGAAAALADFRLPDPDAVLQLVRWLASGAFAAPR